MRPKTTPSLTSKAGHGHGTESPPPGRYNATDCATIFYSDCGFVEEPNFLTRGGKNICFFLRVGHQRQIFSAIFTNFDSLLALDTV